MWNKQWCAYVNHARIRSWNQPVLSNESKVSCSRKQRGPLMGLELTTDHESDALPPTQHRLFDTSDQSVLIICLYKIYLFLSDCGKKYLHIIIFLNHLQYSQHISKIKIYIGRMTSIYEWHDSIYLNWQVRILNGAGN